MKKNVLGLIMLMPMACLPSSTPDAGGEGGAGIVEAGVGLVSDVCKDIQGVDDGGVVRTICATAVDIAEIVAFITTLRTAQDAGPPAACTNLPGTSFCATSAETAKGVLLIAKTREARLSIDGGVFSRAAKR